MVFKISNIEYSRGVMTSLLSSGFTQILIYLTSKTKIQNKDMILYIITFIVANILSYSFDILLAKDNFNGVRVSLYDVKFRFTYLLEKMLSYQIVKFFIIVAIDLILVNSVFKRTRKLLDKKNIKFKNRDQILMFTLTTLSFLLYGNMLRFNWVYLEKTSMTLDVLLMAWLSILFLISIRT
tara:strand:+ start:2960 stop:3502 length:543 start_codon:yes stop_codon:yes gene_type:complete